MKIRALSFGFLVSVAVVFGATREQLLGGAAALAVGAALYLTTLVRREPGDAQPR